MGRVLTGSRTVRMVSLPAGAKTSRSEVSKAAAPDRPPRPQRRCRPGWRGGRCHAETTRTKSGSSGVPDSPLSAAQIAPPNGESASSPSFTGIDSALSVRNRGPIPLGDVLTSEKDLALVSGNPKLERAECRGQQWPFDLSDSLFRLVTVCGQQPEKGGLCILPGIQDFRTAQDYLAGQNDGQVPSMSGKPCTIRTNGQASFSSNPPR